jgi:mono/diheme cytochrome c family protein
MRRSLIVLSAFFIAGIGITFAQQKDTKEQGKETQAAGEEAKTPPEEAAKKNPVKPTAEGLAGARKLYGYHCAMCHGAEGDGKGDLAVQMQLQLHDWRDASSIANRTDGELFYIITNGRGKMVGGEGDRTKEEIRWNLVNLVRSFAKKGAGDKPAAEAPKP